MTSLCNLKRSYKCSQSLPQFYDGGAYVLSSDASLLVCASDESINIVDTQNSSIKSTIDGYSERVTALALSPDDKFLFSASHSRQIRVWDLSTLKCLRSWKGHEGPITRMACDASGGLLATAGSDSKVLVWDVDGGFCTHYFKGHSGIVSNVMFHPDPNKLLLFSAGYDSTVRVWDLTRKKCVATLEKHQSIVTSITLSEDGWTLLSAGRDKVVNLWNLHDYSCKVTIPTYEAVESICTIGSESPFSSYIDSSAKGGKKLDGSSSVYFVTVGERGIVRIWKSDGASCVFEQKTSDVTISTKEDAVKRGFNSAVMLPSGQGLLCVTADQQFFFYYPEDDSDNSWSLVLKKRLVGYNGEITDMKFLGEDEEFLAVSTSLEQVRVYDLATMSCAYVLTGHTDGILCLDTCLSISSRALLVTGSKDNTVRLWDSQNRSCIGLGVGHMGDVSAVSFSKKHRSFFVSASSDRTLKVWSFDGLSDDSTEILNLKAKAVVAAHDKDINALAVAPNDSLVCSGSKDRTARIWKLPDLVSLVVLKGHKRGVYSVEFSPVDQCVITSSGDKTVKIWAISDGSCLKTFEGHTSSVLKASFLTRGTQFVSCGADGLVKLWTVKTNECIATYDEHEDKIWGLAVGKKTEMVATGSADAVISLWHDSTEADKEEAFRKEEEGILKGQELENAVYDADYTKAIQLAFELRRPHKLFELFGALCRKVDAQNQIRHALTQLSKDEFHLLLEYVREWNTKPKFCHIAQSVLFMIFSILPPTEIIEIRGISELLEGLIPYSQRHFTRIDRLERSTFLLDYTLTAMSVMDPVIDDNVVMGNNSQVADGASEKPSMEMMQENGKKSGDQKERTSSKKRKSHKSKDATHKKVTAMSVIDSVMDDNNIKENNAQVADGASEKQSIGIIHENDKKSDERKETTSSKKRKAHKSKDATPKKVKAVPLLHAEPKSCAV